MNDDDDAWVRWQSRAADVRVPNFCFTAAGRAGFVHLQLPNYFRLELTVAKVLGALALVIPGVPSRIKELAYFGFGITILSAIVAHSASGSGAPGISGRCRRCRG